MNPSTKKQTRHYVHGDASEDKPFHYYCAMCDLMVPHSHFNDNRHIKARGERYEQSLKSWRNLKKKRPENFCRPVKPENCIADDAAADLRKARAARSSFFVWLMKQRKRDDPIGDLALDCARDPTFPVSTTSNERLRLHLLHHGACEQALVALDEAIWEYETKPKGRLGISLARRFQIFKRDGYRCQLCGGGALDGKKLEVDHKLPVALGGTNELKNLWTLCFECNRGKHTHSV